MSAATLTKRLLSKDYTNNEDHFFECLTLLLEQFIATRNPIFPRQDIIVCLMKALTGSSSTLLIKLVLTTLTEFCETSSTYNAEFVKRLLVSHKIVGILCIVLSSNRLYKDKRLSELCLSLLRRISDVLLPVEINIVLSDIIPLCISLCNMKKQLLFAFRPAIKQKLTELVVNKSVVLHEHVYETGASKDKCDLMVQLFGCKKVEITHCAGDLFDTSSEVDKNISEEIVSQGLAWCSTVDDANAADADSSAVWRDIIPSEIVHGPHFFGHELDKISQVGDIEVIMQDTVHTSLASAPSSADFVTVWGPITSPHCLTEGGKEIFYRAQVCSRTKEGHYLVISMDYGKVKEVKQSQLYQLCQSLVHILPSSTLFSLKGMRPSPFSMELLSTALSILQILTVGNFTVCESMVNKWSAIPVLLELATVSPDETVSSKTMNVLTHISLCSRVRCNQIVKSEAISETIKLLKRFADMKWRQALLSALTALGSMAMDNPTSSSQFEGGMAVLMGILALYNGDGEIKSAILLSLRNHLGNMDISRNLMEDDNQGPSSQSVSPVKSSTLTSSITERGRKVNPPSSAVTQDSQLVCKSSRERSSSRHRQLDLGALVQQDLYPLSQNHEQQRIATNVPSNGDYYILREKTALKTDTVSSVYESYSSTDTIMVRKVIAGFLNAGISGRIIYGVTCDGIVQGISIDRDRRDELRLGIDRVCNDLEPAPTANRPTLYFIRLCCPEGATDSALRTIIPDRYVIEIHVNANPTICQAFKLRSDPTLYLRVGSQTEKASVQDFRELITRQLEESRQLRVM